MLCMTASVHKNQKKHKEATTALVCFIADYPGVYCRVQVSNMESLCTFWHIFFILSHIRMSPKTECKTISLLSHNCTHIHVLFDAYALIPTMLSQKKKMFSLALKVQ